MILEEFAAVPTQHLHWIPRSWLQLGLLCPSNTLHLQGTWTTDDVTTGALRVNIKRATTLVRSWEVAWRDFYIAAGHSPCKEWCYMRERRERSVTIPLAFSEGSFLLKEGAKSCRSPVRSRAEVFSGAGASSPLHLANHLSGGAAPWCGMQIALWGH